MIIFYQKKNDTFQMLIVITIFFKTGFSSCKKLKFEVKRKKQHEFGGIGDTFVILQP